MALEKGRRLVELVPAYISTQHSSVEQPIYLSPFSWGSGTNSLKTR